MILILFKLIELLLPLTYVAGLIVVIRYFRTGRKAVFILLLCYFLFGIYSCTLARHVNRFVTSRMSTEITQEKLETYEAYQKDVEELHLKHFGVSAGNVTAAVQHVSVPLGQILLVIALIMIGKQTKKKTPNKIQQVTSL